MPEDILDVAIIGCGPAGLQAAIHACGKKAQVAVFGRPEKSSLYKAHVANFCCYEKVVPGQALLDAGRIQAESLGADFVTEDIVETKFDNERFVLSTEAGKIFTSRSLIMAMGAARKKLRVKGEKELVGRGVSYCVDCDATFFRGMDVAVVGNESAAVSGALTLLGFAKKVFLVCRELNISKRLREQLNRSDVQVISDRWVKEIIGSDKVESLLLTENQSLDVQGVFVELGAKGAMELAANLGVMFDAETFSFIETNKKQETNLPGLYAAGDITGQPWQMAKAVGEGCVAGINAAEYAKKLSELEDK
jgi:thioredoxin reductase (NADPH)